MKQKCNLIKLNFKYIYILNILIENILDKLNLINSYN